MKVELQTDKGLLKVEGEPEDVIRTLRMWKNRKPRGDHELHARGPSGFSIAAAYPDWVWGNAHPQRARAALKEFGLASPKQGLLCPRCQLAIKKEGEYLDGGSLSAYSSHVSNSLCLARQRFGDIDKDEAIRLEHQELKALMESSPNRPTCACGCGLPVSYETRTKQWKKYVSGHSEFSKLARGRTIRFLADIVDGEYQDDFRQRKGLNSRDSSRILQRLVVERLIERKPCIHNSRHTYTIHKLDRSVSPHMPMSFAQRLFDDHE